MTQREHIQIYALQVSNDEGGQLLKDGCAKSQHMGVLQAETFKQDSTC